MDSLSIHYSSLLPPLQRGAVVPFLGAGVHLCGRIADRRWSIADRSFLPDGSELADYLARSYLPADSLEELFPSGAPRELTRVSQFIALAAGGLGSLYDALHEVFDGDFPPTLLHRFLAALPGALRARRSLQPYQVIITTNYDDVLERAFREREEPVDLVTYIAEGPERGKFVHQPAGGGEVTIEQPNEYADLPIDPTSFALERTIIVKIHGAINRRARGKDSYVITEDDYIDYLSRADVSTLLPTMLAAKFTDCHFLFLGYGLRDWNLRVILHRIWGERRLSRTSWAIQRSANFIDCHFWNNRDIKILEIGLEEYLPKLAAQLGMAELTA